MYISPYHKTESETMTTKKLFRNIFILNILFIILASLIPTNGSNAPSIIPADKIGHFSAYCSLSLLILLSFSSKKSRVLLLIAGFLLGCLMEFLQSFVGRSTSLYDQMANSLGLLMGIPLFYFFGERFYVLGDMLKERLPNQISSD